jgi:CHAT domain-containing protein
MLGHLSYRAAKCTNDTEHLNNSITTFRDLLNMPSAYRMHFVAVRGLTLALLLRVHLLKEMKDADEIMQLFAVAVSNPYTKVPSRFEVACQWASLARLLRHPSVSAAYESAFSLMQDSLAFAPTLEIQHFRLVAMRGAYEQLPLNYASHLVHVGQIDQAVETLEGGRGLLFSEMRGLRTSLDQLSAIDPPLAEKFADINRDLETLTTTTVSPGVWLNNGGAEAQDTMEPFGHFVIKRRKLTEEREGLISHIRTLPGLKAFLMDPSFDTLRSAAARGPVIIINHSEWRCDIIILLYNSPPSLIPTADYFYDRAKGLRDMLLVARKKGLDSGAYQEALSAVLEGLYDLVGRPVIQRLHELNVPEQSRIWWCPTSIFCSLPLHAMGPIPSDIGPPRYFLDLYIPSYAPSLSALIESRKPGSRTIVKPSLLLVLQPDASMVQALEEMQAVQAIIPWATTLVGATATPAIVLERLQDHQFVHIVCHGILEPGKPFDSSFKLYNGKRLSLLDIIRSQLPNAEFAFLAACHTAELTDESPSDEALHLAAAMQYCGFRSVVGTMWAMADMDGRDLARNFYKALFSGRRQGERYSERTAEALRDAVVKLRRTKGRGMTLERWVNYVHYGA